MRFWDTSAVIPLLVTEPTSTALEAERRRDPRMSVWWGTQVECASTLSRLERMDELTRKRLAAAFDRLGSLTRAWEAIEPTEPIRMSARRLLRVHPLRSADALQLAAAIAAADGRPDSLPFVCLDDRLNDAAEREGFEVLKPA